jgi:hypothetical protein
MYLKNFRAITGKQLFENEEQKQGVLTAVIALLGHLLGGKQAEELAAEEPVMQHLYQYPCVWLIMKDIICPSFQIACNNWAIFAGEFSQVDVAKTTKMQGRDCILLNTDVTYKPTNMAFLLIESMRLSGLDVCCTVKDIFNSELKEKIIGLAKLNFENSLEVNDFILILLMATRAADDKMQDLLDGFLKATANGDSITSYAQAYTGQRGGMGGDWGGDDWYSNWWYLGLIERMLDPVRGADWTTTKALAPFLQEIQNKISEARKKAGPDGLTYEALLRVNSGEMKPKDIQVIEKALAKNRVW